mmetsp:Transcript_128511/g.399910  ORF Transcript_128511/g.399910 Transcript_128511/m.399910 type:complete len:234 (-) Transcript_128511:27-728(-)
MSAAAYTAMFQNPTHAGFALLVGLIVMYRADLWNMYVRFTLSPQASSVGLSHVVQLNLRSEVAPISTDPGVVHLQTRQLMDMVSTMYCLPRSKIQTWAPPHVLSSPSNTLVASWGAMLYPVYACFRSSHILTPAFPPSFSASCMSSGSKCLGTPSSPISWAPSSSSVRTPLAVDVPVWGSALDCWLSALGALVAKVLLPLALAAVLRHTAMTVVQQSVGMPIARRIRRLCSVR